MWCLICHAPWPAGAGECPACGGDGATAVRWSYLPAVGATPPTREERQTAADAHRVETRRLARKGGPR